MKHRRMQAAMYAILLVIVMIAAIASYSLYLSMAASAADRQAFDRQAVEKASIAFASAESILEKLQSIISENLAEEEEESDEEFDPQEWVTFRNEIGGDMAQITMLLSSLDGLTADVGSSEGKTVLAVREYLGMLSSISADMYELIGYHLELYEALEALSDFDEDADYEDFALQLADAAQNAADMMNGIDTPSYLRISHDDLTKRFIEFQEFGEDFYVAVVLEDPLRLYSCIYRMDRISVMLDKATSNLLADVNLQFEQADKRMSGMIATLHNELERNIALLLAV